MRNSDAITVVDHLVKLLAFEFEEYFDSSGIPGYGRATGELLVMYLNEDGYSVRYFRDLRFSVKLWTGHHYHINLISTIIDMLECEGKNEQTLTTGAETLKT